MPGAAKIPAAAESLVGVFIFSSFSSTVNYCEVKSRRSVLSGGRVNSRKGLPRAQSFCLAFPSHPTPVCLSALDTGSWCSSPNSFAGPWCLKNNTGMEVRDKRAGNTRTSCARLLPLLVQINERRWEGKRRRDAGKAAQSLSRWSGVGSCSPRSSVLFVQNSQPG